jgi:hypothetical protein
MTVPTDTTGTTTTAAGATTAGTTAEAGQTATGEQQQTATGTTTTTAPDKVEDLPEWAQRLIRDTRSEAAGARTKLTAAEQTSQGILAAVAKAAGIEIPGEKPDPEKLASDLAASREAAKQASLKLAVYQAAGAHQGNPDALLDSNTFLAGVQALDPTAADFGTQVSEAIKAAVAANPSLKKLQAGTASTVDTSGGTGEQGQLTEEQVAQMSPEQIAEAFDKGQLKHLLS